MSTVSKRAWEDWPLALCWIRDSIQGPETILLAIQAA